MSLENGSVTLKRFYPLSSVPGRSDSLWIEKLNEFALHEVDDLGSDNENTGWAVHSNELSTEFNEKNTVFGPYIAFSYRIDTHKVPSGVVDLHLKAQIAINQEYGEEVGQQQLQDIKDDITQDLLQQTLPSVEVAGVLVDTHNAIIYFTGGSPRLIEGFGMLFWETFGIKIQLVNYEVAAARFLDDPSLATQLMAQPGLCLVKGLKLHHDYLDEPEARMASSFMTWFFYYLQVSESVWMSENVEDIFVLIEDQLSLEGETFGSREVMIKKGDINNCKELAAAFASGKRISKLKISFYRSNLEDGQVWSFNMDKKNFSLSGLKLPKPDAVDRFGKKLERFDSIIEIHTIMDEIYNDYLEMKASEGWVEIEQEMIQWAAEMVDPEAKKIESDQIEESQEEVSKENETNDDLSDSVGTPSELVGLSGADEAADELRNDELP